MSWLTWLQGKASMTKPLSRYCLCSCASSCRQHGSAAAQQMCASLALLCHGLGKWSVPDSACGMNVEMGQSGIAMIGQAAHLVLTSEATLAGYIHDKKHLALVLLDGVLIIVNILHVVPAQCAAVAVAQARQWHGHREPKGSLPSR